MIKNKKGFTLIELLVVIAIIALLSTIAVVSLGNARQKARDTKRIADIKQIQTALELDYSSNGLGYKEQGLTNTFAIILSTSIGTSMTSVPAAPTPKDGSCTSTDTSPTTPTNNNNSYYYLSTNADNTAACTGTQCASYMLQFCTGLATGTIEAGEHCATPSGISNDVCAFPTT